MRSRSPSFSFFPCLLICPGVRVSNTAKCFRTAFRTSMEKLHLSNPTKSPTFSDEYRVHFIVSRGGPSSGSQSPSGSGGLGNSSDCVGPPGSCNFTSPGSSERK